MAKLFKSIPELIELLEMRGARTTDATAIILMREGYYAVVNGYGKAFLDKKGIQSEYLFVNPSTMQPFADYSLRRMKQRLEKRRKQK